MSVQNEHKDIFKLFTTYIIKTYITDCIHQIVLKESIIETFIVYSSFEKLISSLLK